MLQVLHGFSIFAFSVRRKVYNAYNETPTKGKSMRKFTYDFSVLEPIANNDEFPQKVIEPIYTTVGSLFSLKRLVAIAFIAQFANKGMFKEVGRYRLEIVFKRTKAYAHIRRFV